MCHPLLRADILDSLARCPHSLALEHLLNASGHRDDLMHSFPAVSKLRDAVYGQPDNPPFHVSTPDAITHVVSLCFEPGVCGHSMFLAGADRVLTCMACRCVWVG